jgi:hypothetical protein
MFGKKAQEIRNLKGELAIANDRLSQLRATRIRINVPTELGVRPIYDVELEYAIMLTNMLHGGQPGYQVEGMHVEVISQYSPLMEANEGDAEYAGY